MKRRRRRGKGGGSKEEEEEEMGKRRWSLVDGDLEGKAVMCCLPVLFLPVESALYTATLPSCT